MGLENPAYFIVRFLLVLGLALIPSAGSQNALSGGQHTTAPSPARLGNLSGGFFYERTFGVTGVPYLVDNDHIYNPDGVSLDGAGNLWVVEGAGSRVLKFKADGTFLMSIGTPGNVAIADETHFVGLRDVAIDSADNIWITDMQTNRVVKFDPSGNYLLQLGTTWESGQDNAHFDGPVGIAFDSQGKLYVSDFYNHRIQIFDSNGFYLETIGVTGVSGSDNAHFYTPNHIAIDASDNLYVVDERNHRVQIFDRATRMYQATLGTGGGSGNYQFDWPTDVAVDSAGYIYVADVLNTRVQKFNSSLALVDTFGVTDEPYLTDGSHYNQPVDVAVDADGNLAIVEDWGRGLRLIVLNAAGIPQFTIGQAGVWGSDNAHFAAPFGVAFDASGKIYVADCGNHWVQIFSSTGVWGARLGTGYGTGNYQFKCPSGVAFDSSGNIYVADADNHRIQIYSPDRTYLATLGTTGQLGSDKAHFRLPMDVEVDSKGNIYVADTLNHRVQIFNSSRVWQKTLGVSEVCGDSNTHFCEPWGLAIDLADHLYVAEKFNPRIQVFDAQGVFLTTIGGKRGSGAGEFRELYGVAVDKLGNVYAADLLNHRVEKYIPGEAVFLPMLRKDGP